jgi:hypothetical protein
MLIHRILQDPGAEAQLKALLASAHHVDVQNVADWFYSSEQEAWDQTKDTPTLAPPFPLMWMEFGRPNKIVSGTCAALFESVFRIGCLAEATEDNAQATRQCLADRAASGEIINESRHFRDPPSFVARWNYRFLMFLCVGTPKHCRISQAVFHMTIDERGVPSDLLEGGVDFADAASSSAIQDVLQAIRWPFLLAITFMHCKNASMKRLPALDTPKHQLRQGVPGTRFSRIVVAPFRADARRESGDSNVSLKKALHICRGHFKDYRESGLFGKIRGIFWWDQHARGSAEHGVVKSSHVIEVGC